jgi:hypothetical protein
LSVLKVTPTEMERMAQGTLAIPQGKTPYTRVRWEVSYTDAAGSFYEKTMPALARLGAPEDVRIVFWFDN